MRPAIRQCRVFRVRQGSASIDGNTGEFHHLAPFYRLVRDQLAEFGRRHRLRNATDLSESRHQLRILQRLADRLVKRGDDFRRRALGAEMP